MKAVMHLYIIVQKFCKESKYQAHLNSPQQKEIRYSKNALLYRHHKP